MGGFKKWHETAIHLPKVNQTHNYDCGAAALRAVATYYGVGPEDEGDFIKICNTSKKLGTDPTDIVAAARSMGLRANTFEDMSLDDLMMFIERRKPVICAIQAWGDEEDYDDLQSGHYVVVMGYDERYIYFEDPSLHNQRARGRMTHDEFAEQWVDLDRKKRVLHHCGIVVWKPTPPKEQDLVLRTRKVK